MEIAFSPVRRDTNLTLERLGDTLVVNGDPFDFSNLPDGASLPADAVSGDWLAGPVRRMGGELAFHVYLPHGRNAPHAVLFPAPITVSSDGPIDLGFQTSDQE